MDVSMNGVCACTCGASVCECGLRGKAWLLGTACVVCVNVFVHACVRTRAHVRLFVLWVPVSTAVDSALQRTLL